MSQSARVTESPLDRVSPPSPNTRAQGPVIGVDLGTSYCRVGVLRQGQPLLVREGPRPAAIPAFVGLSPQGRILVGQAAQRQLASEPAQTVFGLKRLLAPYRSEEAKALRKQLRCAVYAGPDEQSWVRFGDRSFAPKQLMAMVLCQARELAQNFLGQPVHRAVIAIPPGWGQDLVAGMRDAVALAGMHVAGAVSEPLAAAFALKRPEDAPGRTLLVYDWGGAHFRASLLRATEQGMQLVGTDAAALIGGMDLDQTLLEQMLQPLPERNQLLSDENASSTSRIADAVERAKLSLSDRKETRVRVPFVLPSPDGQGRDLDLPLTRDRLEALAEPFVDRSVEVCRRLLDQQGVFIFDVDEVLLVGGQSRMPLVSRKLSELLPNVPIRAEGPEEAIALGAALAGGRL